MLILWHVNNYNEMPDIKNLKISKIEEKREPLNLSEGGQVERISVPERSFEKEKTDLNRKRELMAGSDKKEGELGLGGSSSVLSSQDETIAREKMIEKILEKDMDGLFLAMTPEKREEFKVVGEETAREINVLLKKTAVKVKKIIELIRKWLLIVPGVNKFFVEQEAKIKADEIMKNRFF